MFICRNVEGKVFHRRSPAAAKLLSLKMVRVGTVTSQLPRVLTGYSLKIRLGLLLGSGLGFG